MTTKVHCSQCGEVEIDDDMGFWCSKCGETIEESTIISSLISAIEVLTLRIANIEHVLRQDGFSDI